MRNFSPTLLIEKNKLNSTNPFTHLFEVRIRTATGPPEVFTYFRLVNLDQPITYNSEVFTPFPIKLESTSDNLYGESRRLSISIANVDQQIIALLENYWAAVLIPFWEVSIWMVDATQPAETPIAVKDVYEVISVSTNLLTSTFELIYKDTALNRLVPSRNYTRSGGFEHIPRKTR